MSPFEKMGKMQEDESTRICKKSIVDTMKFISIQLCITTICTVSTHINSRTDDDDGKTTIFIFVTFFALIFPFSYDIML